MARKVEPRSSTGKPERKASERKTPASKATPRKATARKATARKAAVGKATVGKTAAPRTTTKPATRKPAAEKTSVRKPAVRKVTARKVATRQLPLTSVAEDALAIEAQNRRYYDAFQTLDPEQLGRMWWHDDVVSCVHPGWDMRHGWALVRETYEEIFLNTRSIRFSLGDVRVRVSGDLGYATCIENLVSDEGDNGNYLGAVLATNVFERRNGEWRLIHHHASPFASDEVTIPEGPLH